MTEERKKAVACCPECKLTCWSDSSWECSECGGRWVKAPKHTDEEYQVEKEMHEHWHEIAENGFKDIHRLNAKIKELEIEVKRLKKEACVHSSCSWRVQLVECKKETKQ